MMKAFKISLSLVGLLLVGACQSNPPQQWISPDGRYGQTWVSGTLAMEVAYSDSEECAFDINTGISNDPELRRLVTQDKKFHIFVQKPKLLKASEIGTVF